MRALLVICEGFDFAVEETGVYYARSWVESEVKDLRAEGDDWHRTVAPGLTEKVQSRIYSNGHVHSRTLITR
jgi:hypothetical protein